MLFRIPVAYMNYLRLLSLSLLLFSSTVYALPSDANEPIQIEADQLSYDNIRQIKTFTGNVVLTRGTLSIKAARVIITKHKNGYEYATLYSDNNQLAVLRQQQDAKANIWVEGMGKRIEYNQETGVAELFNEAQVRRLEGKKVMDEVHGEYISYDSRTEVYSAKNSAGEAQPSSSSRIKAIIQPRQKSTNNE